MQRSYSTNALTWISYRFTPEHIIQEKGGTYREQLDELRRHYNVVLHGFGLSIGSSAPLDKEYLNLVKDLLQEHQKLFFPIIFRGAPFRNTIFMTSFH